MVGRIPVMDVTPVVEHGRYPAKAAVGEPFTVSALVFREGHDALDADVVLTDPDGVRRAPVGMSRVADVPDRWTAVVTPDAPGPWTFEVVGSSTQPSPPGSASATGSVGSVRPWRIS